MFKIGQKVNQSERDTLSPFFKKILDKVKTKKTAYTELYKVVLKIYWLKN